MIPSYCLTRKDIITQLQRYGVQIANIPDTIPDEGLLSVLDMMDSLAVKHGMIPVQAYAAGINKLLGEY